MAALASFFGSPKKGDDEKAESPDKARAASEAADDVDIEGSDADEASDEDGDNERHAEMRKKHEEAENEKEKARLLDVEIKKRKLSKSTFDSVNWPFPDKYKNKHTVTVGEIVGLGVPRQELTDYLSQEMAESESCRSMPFAFMLITFYALSATAHENASVVSGVQKAIERNLREHTNFGFTGVMGHNSLEDISSYQDLWSWMHKGFIPNVFGQEEKVTWNTSAPLPADDPRRGMLLHHNRIMGGVRVLMQRSQVPECLTNEDLADDAYLLKCVGGLGFEMDPEQFDVWHFGLADETKWLYAHTDVEVLQNQIRDLEFSQWVDNTTSRLEFGIPVYNAEYGLYVFTKISFFFSRTGRIWKDVSSASVFADWWPTYTYLLVDVTFCCCLMYIIVKELSEVRQMLMTHGGFGCLRLYVNFWNLMDWFAVFAGITIISLFRKNHAYTTEVNLRAAALGEANQQAAGYAGLATAALIALEEELEYAHSFRYAMAGYPLVIMMRLFKAFSAQARLAVVTETLVHASIDLIHFLIVFLSVFGAYVISGVALFGRDVDSFVTPARAFNQLFRALLGDLDWEELRQAGRYEAMSFYCVFRLLMSQIFFNLLISIIMDAYEAVKLNSVGAEMIWDELRQEMVMRFGSKGLVPFWKVVTALQYDDKVDSLKKMSTKPKSSKTTYVEANAGHGTIEFLCFEQYPNMTKLGVETEKAIGTVIVCDGNGGFIEVPEGKITSIPIVLDDHGKFYWYHDSEAVAGAEDKFDMAHAAHEAEDGRSATGMVNVEYLMRTLEQISEKQANQIIEDAVEDFYACHHCLPGPEELRNLVLHLDHRSSKCLRAVMGERKRPKSLTSEGISHAGLVTAESTALAATVAEPLRRGTVSNELAQIFDTTQKATLECKKVMMALDPDMTKTHDGSDTGPDSANFEDLHVGDNVKILDDMRRIIGSCYDANLSVDNSEWRKEAAGCNGQIVEVDSFDKTVCVYIASIGKLWFAAGAIESIFGEKSWGPPREGEMARRKQESDGASERAKRLKEDKKTALQEHFDLERRKLKLDLEMGELRPTMEEANQTCDELQRRVEKQLKAKAQAEHAIKVLQKKQARLMQEGRSATAAVRHDQETLHDLSATRNEYFDTMRSMVTENQELRAQLEEEQDRLSELQSSAAADARNVSQYERDIHHAINELTDERTRVRREEQSQLAWFAGRADALVKTLRKDGRAPDAMQYLLALRNITLETSHILQDL